MVCLAVPPLSCLCGTSGAGSVLPGGVRWEQRGQSLGPPSSISRRRSAGSYKGVMAAAASRGPSLALKPSGAMSPRIWFPP